MNKQQTGSAESENKREDLQQIHNKKSISTLAQWIRQDSGLSELFVNMERDYDTPEEEVIYQLKHEDSDMGPQLNAREMYAGLVMLHNVLFKMKEYKRQNAQYEGVKA